MGRRQGICGVPGKPGTPAAKNNLWMKHTAVVTIVEAERRGWEGFDAPEERTSEGRVNLRTMRFPRRSSNLAPGFASLSGCYNFKVP